MGNETENNSFLSLRPKLLMPTQWIIFIYLPDVVDSKKELLRKSTAELLC